MNTLFTTGVASQQGSSMSVTSFNGRTGVVTLTSADVTSAFVAGSPTTGNLLEWNGTELADSGISAASVGTGTVTSITAGSGLSGGTITTTGTVSLNLANANTWTAQQQLNAGLVTQGQAAATISNVALTSNVVTVTTSAPHGFVAGQWVNVAAGTNTAINGTFPIASVTSTTFTYALTHANIASGADTGTAQVCEQVVLNASGAVQEYVLSTGQRVILTSSGQPLIAQQQGGTTAKQIHIYNDGTNGYVNSNGNLVLGNFQNVILSAATDGSAYEAAFVTGTAFVVRDAYAIGWSGSVGSPDTCFVRKASGVIAASSTPTVLGWLRTAGTGRMTADVTNATATFANLSDTTINVMSGEHYVGWYTIPASNTQAGEGIQYDMNGGTATFTDLQYGFSSSPVGATIGTAYSTAAATPITATTATTGDVEYVIEFGFTAGSTGTVILRAAEVSHLAGTATFRKNGCVQMFDSPN